MNGFDLSSSKIVLKKKTDISSFSIALNILLIFLIAGQFYLNLNDKKQMSDLIEQNGELQKQIGSLQNEINLTSDKNKELNSKVDIYKIGEEKEKKMDVSIKKNIGEDTENKVVKMTTEKVNEEEPIFKLKNKIVLNKALFNSKNKKLGVNFVPEEFNDTYFETLEKLSIGRIRIFYEDSNKELIRNLNKAGIKINLVVNRILTKKELLDLDGISSIEIGDSINTEKTTIPIDFNNTEEYFELVGSFKKFLMNNGKGDIKVFLGSLYYGELKKGHGIIPKEKVIDFYRMNNNFYFDGISYKPFSDYKSDDEQLLELNKLLTLNSDRPKKQIYVSNFKLKDNRNISKFLVNTLVNKSVGYVCFSSINEILENSEILKTTIKALNKG